MKLFYQELILITLSISLSCLSEIKPINNKNIVGFNKDIQNYRFLSEKDFKNLEAVSSHGRDDGIEDLKPSTISVCFRAFFLFVIYSPILISSPLAFLFPVFRNVVWFRLLCHIIGSSGAAFIKWGQWSSTRPDMFPEELCKALSRLHAKAPIHSLGFTKSQILSEFGIPLEKMFESFTEIPIASGSIAQVYRAKLGGMDVAVKVRHPNVVNQIKIDFIIMRWIASFIDSTPGLDWLNLSNSLSQFSETIAAQTRLDVEGKHLILLNRNFKKWKNIGFPRPIVLSESVLIESFELGSSVSEYTEIYKSNDKDKKLHSLTLDLAHFILTYGEDLYLKMLLIDNLMHADLHPGNILVQSKTDCENSLNLDNCANHKKIVLVDAGMVAVLNRKEQENFIGLLAAMGRGDGEEAANFVMNFSVKSEYSPTVRMKFRKGMVELFGKVCRGYGTHVDIGEVLRGILSLVRDNKISIDANYATLVLNAMCLDGLGKQLLPSYSILDGGKPLLEFYRVSRKTIGLGIFYFLAPISQFIKRKNDNFFLKFLKKKYPEYNKHQYIPI